MNRVEQLGNLTRDPELRKTNSGTSVLNCCIATQRNVPKGDGFVKKSFFLDFTMWGATAETFYKFHSKGSKAFIDGHLDSDEWEDKATGQKRSKIKMIATSWYFTGNKDDTGPGEVVANKDNTPF